MGAKEGDEVVRGDGFALEEGDEFVSRVVDAGEQAVLCGLGGVFAADEDADAGAEGTCCECVRLCRSRGRVLKGETYKRQRGWLRIVLDLPCQRHIGMRNVGES